MAFVHGKGTKVAIEGYNVTKYLNEASPSLNAEVAETTVFYDDSKQYVIGVIEGTVTLGGLFDGSAGAIDEVLSASLGTEDGGHFMIFPAGDTNGTGVIFGKGELTSYEISTPLSDAVSISAEIQADGGNYGGTYLRDSGSGSALETIAAGATDNSAGIDNTASSANGAVAQIHVANNTLSGTLDIKVQDSPDNSAWADLITFTQVAAGVETAEQISVTGTVDRYVRSNVVAAAGTGTAEVAVALKRK